MSRDAVPHRPRALPVDLTALALAEYDLTRRLVLEVAEHDRLLADRPVLSRAVALRDPYVDALSHLQLRALTALRDVGSIDPDASAWSASCCSR